MRLAFTSIRFFALLPLWMGGIGCESHAPPTPPMPAATSLFSVDYFLGSALSGPIDARPPIATPANSLSVRATFLTLEKRPAAPFFPVGSRAVFFSGTGGDNSAAGGNSGGTAVLPAAELTRNATIALDLKFPEDLPATLRTSGSGRITPMASLPGSLPPGVTVTFAAMDPNTFTDTVTGSPARRSIEILVSRSASSAVPLQLALVLKDLASDNTLRTETALFNLPAGNHSNTALVIPFRFDDAISRAVAVLIQVSAGTTEPAHIAATTNCLKAISTQLATSQPVISTGQANGWSTVIAAVQSLSPVEGRRSSLTFLADQTGASICEDVAMEADDSVLVQLVQIIQTKVRIDQSPEPDPSVGWLLDHCTLQLLSKLADDAGNGTGKISPELTAILTTHTGEVGRHSSSLDEVLRGLTTRVELDNRLLAENTIYLEDSSPSSRVRAYDWLSARHQAPPGFDPLGSAKSRRDALEQASPEQAGGEK